VAGITDLGNKPSCYYVLKSNYTHIFYIILSTIYVIQSPMCFGSF
jgi:hypothetical protein